MSIAWPAPPSVRPPSRAEQGHAGAAPRPGAARGEFVSIPARLIVPAHRVERVQSDECRQWCADSLRAGVTGCEEGRVYVLLFDDWEDAALFQRRWL